MNVSFSCVCGTSWPWAEGVPSKCPSCGKEADAVCEHGEALDVHCCHCHSGFQFDKDHECHPRRARMDRITPAERAIFEAMGAVEALPADVRLTDAVVLLGAACDSVADYIDGIDQRRYVQSQAALSTPAPDLLMAEIAKEMRQALGDGKALTYAIEAWLERFAAAQSKGE